MKRNDNRNFRKVRTRFDPETRFEQPVPPAAPFRGVLETDLERLKTELLGVLLAGAPDPNLHASLRRATSDAAALPGRPRSHCWCSRNSCGKKPNRQHAMPGVRPRCSNAPAPQAGRRERPGAVIRTRAKRET